MTERSRDNSPLSDADGGAGSDAPPETPRWVKAFAVLTLLVAALFVILMLAGGHHGPGRHFRSNTPAGQAAPRGEPR